MPRTKITLVRDDTDALLSNKTWLTDLIGGGQAAYELIEEEDLPEPVKMKFEVEVLFPASKPPRTGVDYTQTIAKHVGDALNRYKGEQREVHVRRLGKKPLTRPS